MRGQHLYSLLTVCLLRLDPEQDMHYVNYLYQPPFLHERRKIPMTGKRQDLFEHAL